MIKLTFLLLVLINIISGQLFCMQAEAKIKTAEQAIRRADAADRKAEFAAVEEAAVVLSDSVCPACLNAHIWDLIVDYAMDLSTEYEAFTFSKVFPNALRMKPSDIRENGQMEIINSRAGTWNIYSFKDRTVVDNPKLPLDKMEFFEEGDPKTKVSVHWYRDYALINEFSVEEPNYIARYIEVFDRQIAFFITDNNKNHELVVWTPETNKIECAQKIPDLIEGCGGIIPFSRGRLALKLRDQNRVIIVDSVNQKQSELVAAAGDEHRTLQLLELGNGNIATALGCVLTVWNGETYQKLREIGGCNFLRQLTGEIVIECRDGSIVALDEESFVQKQLVKPDSTVIVIKLAKNYCLLKNWRTKTFTLYPADARGDGEFLVNYLNLPGNKEGWFLFQHGHIFQLFEPSNVEDKPHQYNLPEDAIQIIWYDKEAVVQLRALGLELKVKLKDLLQALRERTMKLIAAKSKEPFKFDDTEIAFLSSLPVRVQESIKSHFLRDIV